MTTTAKPRKATTPRKAARPRPANGQVNGQTMPPPEPEVRPPELFEPTTAPQVGKPFEGIAPEPKPVEHPYGDIQVYVFRPMVVQPGDSMEAIVLPHISNLDADVEFFWEIDELDPMHQSFRYMRRANVPKDIQRRVVRLPDEEMGRLFRGWFMGIITPKGVGPPPES